MKDDKFTQGYICAVACLIKSHGCLTEAKEVLRAGVGGLNANAMKRCGVDEYDIEVLKEAKLIK